MGGKDIVIANHDIQLPENADLEKFANTSLYQGIENIRKNAKQAIINQLQSINIAEMIVVAFPDIFEQGRQKCLGENVEDKEIYPWLVNSILNLLTTTPDLQLPRDIALIKKTFLRKCSNMCRVRRGDAAGTI